MNKSIRKIVLPVFFLIPIIHSLAQNRVDSLITSLNKVPEDSTKADLLITIANELRNGDPRKCLDYAGQALALSTKIHLNRGISSSYVLRGSALIGMGKTKEALLELEKATAVCRALKIEKDEAAAFHMKGIICYYNNDFSQALKNYFISMEIRERIGNRLGASDSYNNISLVYQALGKYPEALLYNFKALKIREELKDRELPVSYNNIGNIYELLNDLPKAVESYKAALNAYAAKEDHFGMAQIYNNIGELYARQNDYVKARDNYAEGLKVLEGSDNALITSALLNNSGMMYAGTGDYDQALVYLEKSLDIREANQNNEGIAASNINLGTLYLLKKQPVPASAFFKKALGLSLKTGIVEQTKRSYLGLAQVDSALKDYRAAFEDYKNYILYKDRLINEESTKKTIRSQMQYDFERKESETKTGQEKKDVLAAEELKQQKQQRNYFVAGFVLMLLLTLLILRSYRQKNTANRIIAQQKEEVEQQKHLIEERNKEITDSISYAKRLQEAILPPRKLIDENLPENFVLYKPKDIVAGDFYWMEVAGGTILIAAADCTGHGVPGAMVSVVCSNALNRTVKEFGITEPGKILDKVRELVIETFQKSESEVMDGMDISICAIDRVSHEVKWAGANNPLWYLQEGRIRELKANKQPIGNTENPQPFDTHSVQMKKGDILYLLTDGYADQFGGEKGKKFKHKPFLRLLEKISNAGMKEQAGILDNAIEKWKGNLEQVDDILVMGIKI
jgi:serine phosphatase RsbU (regulator of sigma subunit)